MKNEIMIVDKKYWDNTDFDSFPHDVVIVYEDPSFFFDRTAYFVEIDTDEILHPCYLGIHELPKDILTDVFRRIIMCG